MIPPELDALPLFQGTSEETRRLLAERGVVRTYAAGSVVWHAGDPARGLHVLLEGRVRVVRERDGREIVVHRAGSGATLGEIPLFDGGGYPATLLTTSPATFLVVDRRLLDDVIRREPVVAERLLETLGGRVRELAERLEGVAAGSVASRLAAFLVERASASEADFTLGMTQEALAAELGTVREVVSRALADLVADGVLSRVGRARYRLERVSALESRAKRAS